jgi:acetylornithine deacetylase
MSAVTKIENRIAQAATACRSRLTETIANLVRIPSENTPPAGNEEACQEYVARRLAELGIRAETYSPSSVSGLDRHPVYRQGRDYSHRPNIAGTWKGAGGGRSLLLSGHIDTVPRGSEPWVRHPFGAAVEGNRLYGLGANDMKAGIAAILVALEILKKTGIRLNGDLLLETIVDEEFGGVNGTLSARLRGHNADAAIICEPSQLAICPAQTGGRTVHVTTKRAEGGILGRSVDAGFAEPVRYLLERIRGFAWGRQQSAPDHPLYAPKSEAVPVWVTKISSGGWGSREPITLPSRHRLEIYWQTMPGETEEQVNAEFLDWFDGVTSARPDLFPEKPDVDFAVAWLPGSAIDARHELVTELAGVFKEAAGSSPRVHGIGGPCDMFVFHQHFNTPAVLFGPVGGNTHAPDEWVDLDSATLVTETLARFICRWCGVAV